MIATRLAIVDWPAYNIIDSHTRIQKIYRRASRLSSLSSPSNQNDKRDSRHHKPKKKDQSEAKEEAEKVCALRRHMRSVNTLRL
jgi:hypothetical protein